MMKQLLPLVLIILFTASCISQLEDYVHYPNLKGPENKTILPAEQKTAWNQYGKPAASKLAIYLSNTDSAWTGLVHSLKTWGVPLYITTDLDTALESSSVFIYPIISGKTFTPEQLDKLRSYVKEGGNLMASRVLVNGIQDLFGVNKPIPSKKRTVLLIDNSHSLARFAQHPNEINLSIGNKERPNNIMGTYGYSLAGAKQVASYDDGSCAMAFHRFGKGTTLVTGFDPGFLFLRGFNDTDDEATKHYINHYEPTIDIITRIFTELYRSSSPGAVTLGTVPDGKSLSVIITHDVDYNKSLENSLIYAEYEQSQGVSATYFMQAKYFTDYFDTVFFDDRTGKLMKTIRDMGMEIASHSVAHSDVFDILPVGDGEEYYPDYQPRIMKRKDTRKASVLGELRVSKFLLEHFSGYEVLSFRPGFLAYPKSLPQALEATGYRFSSSIAGNNAMTQMPYRLNYNRNYRSPSATFEFPLAIEDEHKPRMDKRLDKAVTLANQLRKNGGLCIVLIHPNITDWKLAFLKGFIPAVKKDSWMGNLKQFGLWWAARDQLDVTSEEKGSTVTITITAPAAMKGLPVIPPVPMKLINVKPANVKVIQKGKAFVIDELKDTVVLMFKK